MRLLAQSGTGTTRFSNPGIQAGETLKVDQEISLHSTGLEAWKFGVIFAISDIRLQVNLKNSLLGGTVPSINYEDSTATRLQKAVEAKNISARMGLEFFINSKSIGLIELKNYGIIYSLPIIGKIGEERKLLGRNDILSASIINLGYGTLALNDYIDISIDYIFEFDGFKPNDDLLLKFE